MPFAHFNLHASLLKALKELKYTEATPIQKQAIPLVLEGSDVIATAPTGTGKTAAYLLPALNLIAEDPRKNPAPRILILAPTRELAHQIQDAAAEYGRFLRLNVVSILGGMPYRAQLRQLSKPVDILVATPGRLIDYIESRRIDLSAVEMLILDEADRMLDMGFIHDVKHIAKATAAKRQTLLFTATLDQRVAKLAQGILHKPKRVEVVGKKVTLENIQQRIQRVDSNAHKIRLLKQILSAEPDMKAIIFSATKRGADQIANHLYDDGHRVGALHGDMKQNQRNRTLMQLRSGKIQLLVATDVAARGIDIDDINYVFNFDLPRSPEDYVHRIGRTGRAGRKGKAITFVTSGDRQALKRIERFTQQTLRDN